MNEALKDIKPSATLVLAAKAKELRKQGEDVLSFTAGEPDFQPPKHVVEAVKNSTEKTRYTPNAGIPELRQAIADKLKRENNIEYSPEEIIACTGGKQALYNTLLAILNPGDEIIIPSPYWLTYPEQARLCRVKPVIVPTKDFVITSEILKENITEKTRMIILNSPSNPTGAVVPREEIEKIAKLAIEKDIYVISDEVYEHFTYSGEHISIASLSEEIKKKTITINAISKTYAVTGWRLGYAAGPKEIIKAMTTIQSHTTSAPNSIAQHAAVAALTGPQDSVSEMKQAFDRRRKLIVDGLNDAGLKCELPGGAFYVFPEISGSSEKFAAELLEKEKVAVVPGAPFGSDKHIRLSYATDDDTIKKGVERIKRFMQS